MKIVLINMPFSSASRPSIALTQLSSVVRKQFGNRVKVELLYLNHHFAKHIGPDAYAQICDDLVAQMIGFGDWFFRQSAFPELADNSAEYFAKFRFYLTDESKMNFYRDSLKPLRDNLNSYLDHLINQYSIHEADLVGFSSVFSQTVACTAMAVRLKARRPELITVIGGANVEAGMGIEVAQHFSCFDHVFSGPALRSFPELIGCLLEGRRADTERIDGVFTRSNTRSILNVTAATPSNGMPTAQMNGISAIGQELDINADVELDFDSFMDSHQKLMPPDRRHQPILTFETSRGCWWGQKSHCTFCGLNSNQMYYRSMDTNKAVTLLRGLFERYANRVDNFSAVDNILPKHYVSEVFSRLNVPDNVTLFYEVKVGLKEDDFKALAKARVLSLQPGIEALSTPVLRLMRKGTTAFDNIQFMKRSANYNIQLVWNILVGFPGEKAEVFEKYLNDLPLLTHLPPPLGVFPVRFDRFSPYFNHASEYQLDLQPAACYPYIYPFPEPVLRQMAYFFWDNNTDSENWVYTLYLKRLVDLTLRWQMRWFRRDKASRPQLHFKATGSNVVVDTRFEAVSEIVLNEAEMVILEALQNPLDMELLRQKHPQFSPEEIRQLVQSLSEKKLLFPEGGRLLSLVLQVPP